MAYTEMPNKAHSPLSEHENSESVTTLMVNRQESLTTIGQLTAGFAHDFNNLMGMIIGQAELMRLDSNLSSETQAGLSQIVHSSQQAAQRLRQILDFSRKSTAIAPMVDIVSWLTDFGMETSQQLPSNIKLVTNIEKTDAHCKIDPEQLQQIIQHLVTNAQEAMPAGGKLTIHSSTLNLTTPELAPHVKMRNGLWFIIQVSDTGVGISDNIIPHLYEPFFSTKENRLGLGLAHVYSVVKQYNGHISLNSQSGKGTSVTLYLPCQQQTTDSQVAQKLSFQRGNGQTLLLVEDEPIVLKVTTAMLTRLGYQVMSASSGQAALHLHEQYQDQIDVVLIDLTMPDFEGLSLVAALVAQNPTVKVIALTSRVPDSEAQILAAPGIVSWVQKPLDMAQLGQLVSTWVS